MSCVLVSISSCSKINTLETFAYFALQISLLNKSLAEAQQILKSCDITGFSNLTIEYDVSVIQNLEYSVGPLLIELERAPNERMGLVLNNYSNVFDNDYARVEEVKTPRVFIANILPASLADR